MKKSAFFLSLICLALFAASLALCGEEKDGQGGEPKNPVPPPPVVEPVHPNLPKNKHKKYVGYGFQILGNGNGEYFERSRQIFDTQGKFQESDHHVSWVHTKDTYNTEDDVDIAFNGNLKLGVDTPQYGATVSTTFKVVRSLIKTFAVRVSTSSLHVKTVSAVNTHNLNQDFLNDLASLPETVDDMADKSEDPKAFSEDKKKYIHFLNKWGTHYIHSATLGGEFIIISKNKKTDKKTQVDLDASIDAKVKMVTAGIGGGMSVSKRSLKEKVDFTFEGIGGDAEKLGRLLATVDTDAGAEDYKDWAQSIANNPSVISFQVKPIDTVVSIKDMDRRRTLNQAIKVYNGVAIRKVESESESGVKQLIAACQGTPLYDFYVEYKHKDEVTDRNYKCKADYEEDGHSLRKSNMRVCVLHKGSASMGTISDINVLSKCDYDEEYKPQPHLVNDGILARAVKKARRRICLKWNPVPEDKQIEQTEQTFVTNYQFVTGSTPCPQDFHKIHHSPKFQLHLCIRKCKAKLQAFEPIKNIKYFEDLQAI